MLTREQYIALERTITRYWEDAVSHRSFTDQANPSEPYEDLCLLNRLVLTTQEEARGVVRAMDDELKEMGVK